MQTQQKHTPDIYGRAVRFGGVANDISLQTIVQAEARKEKNKASLAKAASKGDREMVVFLSSLYQRNDMLHRIYAAKRAA